MDIPAAVLDADRVHHDLLRRVAFSRHLNPTNRDAARLAFLAGATAPPFSYIPLPDPQGLLALLDRHEPPRDHPSGQIVGACFDSIRLLIEALAERSAAAFDRLACAAGWYPEPEMLRMRFPSGPAPVLTFSVDARQLMARLRRALTERALDDWSVEADTVMSARVLVDSARRLLRVNPRARFHHGDLERLVVHEIDVHAVRSANGQRQKLRCFETGLLGSLITEEGLAMVAEELAGVSSPGALPRQVEVVRAVELARHVGFRELYQQLKPRVGSGLAWGICLRVKRGLAHPDQPGVYAKDTVYLKGRMKVREWLDDGGDITRLYVGKVALHHPVGAWLEQGWVRAAPVPELWRRPAGGAS